MDIALNWERIKTHRERLTNKDIQGLATVLFYAQEDWLAQKMQQRDEASLAMAFLAYLGQQGSMKAVSALLRQLENREEVFQVAAAEGLKLCPADLALAPLTRMVLRQGQGAIKAGEVLLSYGKAGTDALWQLWFGQDRDARAKALILRLLAEAKDQRAEPLAFMAFLSGEEELLREGLVAAERLGARTLWGNVAECLRNPSWRLRGKAARLLGLWKAEETLRFLIQMGEDPDPWVEEERLRAIAAIDGV